MLGDTVRTVSLAHQVEAMARAGKRLPDIERIIRRIERTFGRASRDRSAEVAAMLDRRIAKQKREDRKREAAHQPSRARE